ALLWQGAHGAPVRRALFSSKGERIMSGGGDGTVKIWDSSLGKQVTSMAAHEGPVYDLALTPDGAKLITSGADKLLKFWNLPGATAMAVDTKPAIFTLPAPARNLALSPNGAHLAASVTEPQGNVIL